MGVEDRVVARERPDHHRVAIVGGGASGMLTALQLLSGSTDSALCVTVHEATGVLGPGASPTAPPTRGTCSTSGPHTLSAYADVPSDLLDWAPPRVATPTRRASSRMDFAAYLQDTLAGRRPPADHQRRPGRDVSPSPAGSELGPATGCRPRPRSCWPTATRPCRPLHRRRRPHRPARPPAEPWDLAAIRAAR